jgi:hypothetical protein
MENIEKNAQQAATSAQELQNQAARTLVQILADLISKASGRSINLEDLTLKSGKRNAWPLTDANQDINISVKLKDAFTNPDQKVSMRIYLEYPDGTKQQIFRQIEGKIPKDGDPFNLAPAMRDAFAMQAAERFTASPKVSIEMGDTRIVDLANAKEQNVASRLDDEDWIKATDEKYGVNTTEEVAEIDSKAIDPESSTTSINRPTAKEIEQMPAMTDEMIAVASKEATEKMLTFSQQSDRRKLEDVEGQIAELDQRAAKGMTGIADPAINPGYKKLLDEATKLRAQLNPEAKETSHQKLQRVPVIPPKRSQSEVKPTLNPQIEKRLRLVYDAASLQLKDVTGRASQDGMGYLFNEQWVLDLQAKTIALQEQLGITPEPVIEVLDTSGIDAEMESQDLASNVSEVGPDTIDVDSLEDDDLDLSDDCRESKYESMWDENDRYERDIEREEQLFHEMESRQERKSRYELISDENYRWEDGDIAEIESAQSLFEKINDTGLATLERSDFLGIEPQNQYAALAQSILKDPNTPSLALDGSERTKFLDQKVATVAHRSGVSLPDIERMLLAKTDLVQYPSSYYPQVSEVMAGLDSNWIAPMSELDRVSEMIKSEAATLDITPIDSNSSIQSFLTEVGTLSTQIEDVRIQANTELSDIGRFAKDLYANVSDGGIKEWATQQIEVVKVESVSLGDRLRGAASTLTQTFKERAANNWKVVVEAVSTKTNEGWDNHHKVVESTGSAAKDFILEKSASTWESIQKNALGSDRVDKAIDRIIEHIGESQDGSGIAKHDGYIFANNNGDRAIFDAATKKPLYKNGLLTGKGTIKDTGYITRFPATAAKAAAVVESYKANAPVASVLPKMGGR